MKIYKILRTILLLILFIILGLTAYNFLEYKKNAEIPKEALHKNNVTEIDIKRELLELKIDTTEKFISEIQKLDTIYFAKRNGEITLSHDKTPNGSKFTEWAVNSDIEVTTTYEALYGIESKYVSYIVDKDGDLNIVYNDHFLDVKSLDLKEISFVENKSFLGKEYTKEDLLAIRKLSKEKITELLLEEDNFPTLNENILEYFTNEAKAFGLDKIIINDVEIIF